MPIENIDYKRIKCPDSVCQFCNGTNGHEEEIEVDIDEYFPLGLATWFCCHDCRDKGEGCETFLPYTYDESKPESSPDPAK